MRGYNRQKADLQPYPSLAKSREEIAANIAAGNPPPVQYSVRPGERLPAHLQRKAQ